MFDFERFQQNRISDDKPRTPGPERGVEARAAVHRAPRARRDGLPVVPDEVREASDNRIRRVSLIETPASSKSALELAGVSISALYFLTVASSTQIGILESRH